MRPAFGTNKRTCAGHLLAVDDPGLHRPPGISGRLANQALHGIGGQRCGNVVAASVAPLLPLPPSAPVSSRAPAAGRIDVCVTQEIEGRVRPPGRERQGTRERGARPSLTPLSRSAAFLCLLPMPAYQQPADRPAPATPDRACSVEPTCRAQAPARTGLLASNRFLITQIRSRPGGALVGAVSALHPMRCLPLRLGWRACARLCVDSQMGWRWRAVNERCIAGRGPCCLMLCRRQMAHCAAVWQVGEPRSGCCWYIVLVLNCCLAAWYSRAALTP